MAEKYRYFEIDGASKSLSLRYGELDVLRNKCDESKGDLILLKVAAIGLNRSDILQIAGLYPAPMGYPNIPGLEVSGIDVKTGKRYVALLPSGGFAEYVLAPKQLCYPIDLYADNVNLVDAATLPEACCTVYQSFFDHIGLPLENNSDLHGQSILVHAATSGIGCLAVQTALHLGLDVSATSGSTTKLDKLQATIPLISGTYTYDQFQGGAAKYDFIIDVMGAEYFADNIKALKKHGHLYILAILSGSVAPQVKLSAILMKNLKIHGSTLKDKTVAYKGDLLTRAMNYYLPLISSCKIKSIIYQQFNFEETPKALEHMASRQHIGKIVVVV